MKIRFHFIIFTYFSFTSNPLLSICHPERPRCIVGVLEESIGEGSFQHSNNINQIDSSNSIKHFFSSLNELIKDIYTLRINRQSAMHSLKQYHDELKKLFSREKIISAKKISFPLVGYSPKALIGSKGKGFLGEKSYNFFDGNAHKGHPAMDLFIYDRNQDCIDDRTNKAISVASVTNGVVVCTNTTWSVDSCDAHHKTLRGGKYIFIYSPRDDALLYYAHLDTINVYAGQKVKSGDVLGTVGRTGANAMMKRSSTHLHIMMLDWKEDGLIPKNPYYMFVK